MDEQIFEERRHVLTSIDPLQQVISDMSVICHWKETWAHIDDGELGALRGICRGKDIDGETC